MSLLLSWLVLAVGFVQLLSAKPTVSFCQNSKKGKWRHELTQVLLEVPFTVDNIECEGIDDDQFAVSVRHTSGLTEIVSQSIKVPLDSYYFLVASKITSEFVINVDGPVLKTLLNGTEEAIIAYIKKPNSKDHLMFYQALMASNLPKSFKIFQMFNKASFPESVKPHIIDNIHIWVFTDGFWSHIFLPHNVDKTKPAVLSYLIKVFKNLQYPLKVEYKSLESFSVYRKAGFHLFTVYHHSDQLEEVHDLIVDPLKNVFRPSFVFITFDIDKNPLPADINSNGPFPYIVTLAKGQKSGVHINSQFTPYTFEKLKDVLESIIDPAINHEVGSKLGKKGVVLTNIDVQTLANISDEEKVPALGVFCEKDSPDCFVLEEKMTKAMVAIHKVEEDYEIMLYLVQCNSKKEVTFVDLPRLPSVAIRDNTGTWSLYNEGGMSVTKFMRAIQDYGAYSENDEDSEASQSQPDQYESESDYYNSFKELEEDDPIGQKFPEYLVVPPKLPILTIDNYTDFIEQRKKCVIGFFVPYCLQCKPMIYHLVNSTDRLQQDGMFAAVVNCANYPDVCEIFEVYQYPTVLYRRDFSDKWVEFSGVLSNTRLTNLANNAEEEEKAETGKSIVKMTPSVLLSLLDGEGLSTLLMLVSNTSPGQMETEMLLSAIPGYKIHWLDSNQYLTLSEFLIGEHDSNNPILVWVDYVKGFVYRLHLNNASPDTVQKFVTDIENEDRAFDDEITIKQWKPISEPLEFPSNSFLSKNDDNYSEEEFYEDDGASIHDQTTPPHHLHEEL